MRQELGIPHSVKGRAGDAGPGEGRRTLTAGRRAATRRGHPGRAWLPTHAHRRQPSQGGHHPRAAGDIAGLGPGRESLGNKGEPSVRQEDGVRARATNAAAKMDRHLGEEQARAAGRVPLGRSPPNGHLGGAGGSTAGPLGKGCSPLGGRSRHKGPELSKRQGGRSGLADQRGRSLCGPWLGPSPTGRQGL